MASFAVSGARLGVVRPGVGGGSARSGGERRSGVDLPPVLFRRKDSFSRTILSCAGAPGKVLVPGGGSDDLLSSAEPTVDTPVQSEELEIPDEAELVVEETASSSTAEASSAVEVEEKSEPSEVIEGTGKTETDDVAVKAAPLVEEKPRVVPPPGDGQRIYQIDPMLEGFRNHLDYRYSEYKRMRAAIDQHEGGLDAFSRGYEKLGFTRTAEGITYREWAPGAHSAALVGDFNNWNPNADTMTRNEFGVWEIFLPNNADGSPAIPHGSRVKIRMDTPSGVKDSIPAWIKFSVQAPGEIPYNGIYYDPPEEEKYVFKHPQPKRPKSLRIYESHVGMSSPVLRFLLSNARWWLEEYKFDGFRFDGVTSMMYTHHGLQVAFTGNYGEYFGFATDVDAVVYLMLVNDLIHGLYPEAVAIGEDVSGMPTFCIPVQDGGVGFDYRLHMAVPDKWIELLKQSDEYWKMGDIVHTLTNRRWLEKCVTYAESHDQALVGDKTIAFWLMDKFMTADHQYVSRKHEEDKMIIFERGNLVFVFNFHWSNSYFDYRVGCFKPGKYKIVLDSDDGLFGGFSRLDHDAEYFTADWPHDNRPCSFSVYAPSRTAVVMQAGLDAAAMLFPETSWQVDQAARTAVLSTRWLDAWRGTPLRLDDLELPATPCSTIARAAAASGAPWAARADAVSLALASHPGPVDRFRLSRTTLRARVPAAEAWFRDLAAGDRRAREVSLVCPPEWCHRALADPLLASPTLETLALGECRFSDAGAAAASASRLTELSLSRTQITEVALQSLLSGCPALRSIMLSHIQGPRRIHISSCRSLVLLGVWQYKNLEELTVEDAPRLERLLGDTHLGTAVTIVSAPKLTALGYLVVGFRNSLPGIDKPGDQKKVCKGLSAPFNSVKILAISATFSSKKNMDLVMNLLKCFPVLETLHIKNKRGEEEFHTIDSNYYHKLYPIGCVVNHLKSVLEIMKIEIESVLYVNPAWIMEQQNVLCQCHRASMEAKVVFKGLKAIRHKGFSIEAINALPDPFDSDIDIMGYENNS
nr:unnamed protein product [Digitaria exilis]